ncbi:hypothetical protein SAZ11_19280 [Streptomyces sp. FXJ1.4098]|nr:hypothetical protein [Streptomyces sp. FXJ1.4098]
MSNDTCSTCRHYVALRELAKSVRDYGKATNYEVLRRRHPAHTVHIPQQPKGPAV